MKCFSLKMFGKILVKVIGASVAQTVTATKHNGKGGLCVKSPLLCIKETMKNEVN
jgi:hypothetical protein